VDHAPALGFATLKEALKEALKEEGRKRYLASHLFCSSFLPDAARPNMLPNMLNVIHTIPLDYLSCILTVLATVLIGKKLWQGWVVAAVNSAVVCVIGVRTAQFGFVPANILCIALYASNLVHWRPKKQNQ